MKKVKKVYGVGKVFATDFKDLCLASIEVNGWKAQENTLGDDANEGTFSNLLQSVDFDTFVFGRYYINVMASFQDMPVYAYTRINLLVYDLEDTIELLRKNWQLLIKTWAFFF